MNNKLNITGIKFWVLLEKDEDDSWVWDNIQEAEPTDKKPLVVDGEQITKWVEHYASAEMAVILRDQNPSDNDIEKIWEWTGQIKEGN